MADAETQLTLYVRDYCMYCHRVMHAANDLGVELEIRNIWEERAFEQELLQGTGRSVVPVLKIEESGVDQRWMPESADIVRYLQSEFAPA